VVPRPRTPDPVRRSAARAATIVAVPVALLIAVGSLWAFGGFSAFGGHATPAASSTSAGPQPSSLVSLPTPTLPDPVLAVCREVIAKLPPTVLGAARRPVTGAEQNAAYGDPPFTVACGVPSLTVGATEILNQLSGVCWVARPGTDTTVWTTVDRTVPVSVTVPGPSAGSGQAANAVSTAVGQNDPTVTPYPLGCTH
jgi:Protein of unknown function (DUF3515)